MRRERRVLAGKTRHEQTSSSLDGLNGRACISVVILLQDMNEFLKDDDDGSKWCYLKKRDIFN